MRPLLPVLLLVGCDGQILSAPPRSGPDPEEPVVVAPTLDPVTLTAPQGTVLLTKEHLRRTLEQQFGISGASLTWDEPSLGLYESNRLAQAHTLTDFDDYFAATEALVAAHLQRFLACEVASLDTACVTATVRSAGKRLFRRTLTDAEVARYAGIAGSQGDGRLAEGVRYALVALLNSSELLYQPLYGEDGRLSDLELAARLSFFVSGANPDVELIDAAERGDLATSAGLAAQVDRLLANDAANARRFADVLYEIWRVNRLDESLIQGYFPQEIAALEGDFAEEFRRTAHEIHGRGDWRLALTHDRAVVNRKLALHYGLSPVPADDATWQSVGLDSKRSGLLSTGLMLAAHSGSKYTSTIHRGLFTLNHLLCRTISTPPNLQELIDQSGVVLSEQDTVRERVEKVSATQPCGSCHNQFDPIGMVYENFDGFGRWSATRYGQSVDARSTVEGHSVENVAGLAQVLARDDARLARCFFKKVFTYATGALVPEGVDLLPAHGVSGEQRFDFEAIVRAVALNEGFRKVRAP